MTNNGKQTVTSRLLVQVQSMYSKQILLMFWDWYVVHSNSYSITSAKNGNVITFPAILVVFFFICLFVCFFDGHNRCKKSNRY